MILYLTMLLSKAAESDRCRGGQSANRTFDREDHLHSRVQKESSDITAKAISDAALMILYLTIQLSKAAESAHRRLTKME